MSKTTTPLTSSPAIPCAVIYAGTDLLLAMESRAGRFPVMVLSAEMPCIEWISADGVQEHIALEGDTAAADHRNLRIEMERGELLIAEVLDPSDSLLQNPAYHLLGMNCPSEPRERCA